MEGTCPAPGLQEVNHLTIRAPDYFKWTALYLCGPKHDSSGFGWSDREDC